MGDCHGAVGHGAPPCRGQRPQCLPAADGQKVVALARDGFARDGSGVDHRKYGALTGTYMGNAYGLKKYTMFGGQIWSNVLSNILFKEHFRFYGLTQLTYNLY